MVTLKEFRNRTQALPEETRICLWSSTNRGQIGGFVDMMDCVGEGENPWVVELYHELPSSRQSMRPKPATERAKIEYMVSTSTTPQGLRDALQFNSEDGWELAGMTSSADGDIVAAWKRTIS